MLYTSRQDFREGICGAPCQRIERGIQLALSAVKSAPLAQRVPGGLWSLGKIHSFLKLKVDMRQITQ